MVPWWPALGLLYLYPIISQIIATHLKILCEEMKLVLWSSRKVHGANLGPIWGRQDPGGPHVGPMSLAIWDWLQWLTGVKEHLNSGLPMTTSGPLYQHGLTCIITWIGSYIHYKAWNEIIYPFSNFNGAAIEVWEWMNNFISHFSGHVITYPCWD